MKSKTLWLAVPAAIVALPVASALGAGAKPTRGAIYEGRSLSFEVSPNGRSLTNFHGPYEAACAGPAAGNPNWQRHARISRGQFTLKEILPARSKNSVILTGRFTARGGVKGKIKVTTQCLLPPNFNSGPVKHATRSWSATSEPAGPNSRYCEDRSRHVSKAFGDFNFSGLLEKGTSCPAVYHAIKVGKIKTFLPPATPAPPEFTAPGWTCSRSSTSGVYRCQREKAYFSFINGV